MERLQAGVQPGANTGLSYRVVSNYCSGYVPLLDLLIQQMSSLL